MNLIASVSDGRPYRNSYNRLQPPDWLRGSGGVPDSLQHWIYNHADMIEEELNYTATIDYILMIGYVS